MILGYDSCPRSRYYDLIEGPPRMSGSRAPRQEARGVWGAAPKGRLCNPLVLCDCQVPLPVARSRIPSLWRLRSVSSFPPEQGRLPQLHGQPRFPAGHDCEAHLPAQARALGAAAAAFQPGSTAGPGQGRQAGGLAGSLPSSCPLTALLLAYPHAPRVTFPSAPAGPSRMS